MPKIPQISEAEWEVMRVLWADAPQTANDVCAALAESTTWNPRTIKTLLNRLVNKGALNYTQHGRMYLYRPAVSESACIRAASRTFLKRVFGGSLTPMLAHFLEEEKLSASEIAELRSMLDERRG
jgi:BlaI family penicillinase repressor